MEQSTALRVELELGNEPDAASRARHALAEGLPGTPRTVLDDAQLVVTELVSNAQLHGEPPHVVRVLARPGGVRVEVEDQGQGLLILPAASADAMTGRGLGLVAALVHAWGVEPTLAGGKRVWAELRDGTDERPEAPQVDVDALLASWQDDEADPVFDVRLGAVPTDLLLAAKRHIDNVVREFTFERAAADGPLPPEVEALIDTVTKGFARARTAIKEQAAAAARAGEPQTELALSLPASSAAAGERYLRALDEADRYARAARLLTLETPPLHRLFRRWYVSSFVEQLRARSAGRTPPSTTPFVSVLAREVEQLSALRRAEARLDLLQQVTAALTTADSVGTMAAAVIEAAVRDLDAVTARVYVLDGRRLRAVGSFAAPQAAVSAYDEIDLDDDLPGAEAARTGQTVVLHDLGQLVARYPRLAGVYDSERTLHVAPLQVGDHVLGVLALGFAPTSGHDAPGQTALVRALADALAQGLERLEATRLLRALPDDHERTASVLVGGEGTHRLKSLADAAGAIAGARDVEALLQVVAEAARTVVGCHQSVATRLYGPTWEGAVTVVSLSDTYARWRSYDQVPQGLGVLNEVTATNAPLRLTAEQLRAHPRYRGLRDAPGHPPLPDYLAAPLISRDGTNIGLVQLSHKTDGTDFTEVDEAAAVQLALMASSALEHLEVAHELTGALQRLRRERDLVDALHDVGRAVTARLEHDEVVQTVTDAATTMTGAEFGAFFYNVVGDDGEAYSLYTISGVPRSAFERFPMPRNTAVFAPTFEGQGVVRLDDVTTDPRYGLSDPHHGMPEGHLPVRSYLAVPVHLSTGEVIGGLFFGHHAVRVFDQDAERIAVGLAGYAAIALENGRLYDAARREGRARERTTAALERPLQPPELPRLEHAELHAVFHPFGGDGQLAGDLYDVFPLPDGRWLLALGDVSGKGPEAAAVAGLVRHTLWAAAQSTSDPAGIARVVNGALLRQDGERFATLVVAVLTPAEGGTDVEAVWAGHAPGLLCGADGTRSVGGTGMPVGMFDDLDLETVRFRVPTGASLLLHTDGLLEREGAVLDDRVLVDVLDARADLDGGQLLAALVATVDGHHPPRDDVAALLLRPV